MASRNSVNSRTDGSTSSVWRRAATATAAAPSRQDHHDHPDGHHGRMLLGGRTADQGHELVEPGVVLEQHVEVEQVVGRQRRADAVLARARPATSTAPAARPRTRGGRRCGGWPRARTVCAQPGHTKRYALGMSSSLHTRTVRSSIWSCTSPHAGHWARTVVIEDPPPRNARGPLGAAIGTCGRPT